MQRVGIEKTQRRPSCNAGGLRCLFLLDQEQLVLANMLWTELIGRLAKMFCELRNRVQVNPDGDR